MKNEVHSKALSLINDHLDLLKLRGVLTNSDRDWLVRVLDKTQDTTQNINSNVSISMTDDEILKMLGEPDEQPKSKTKQKGTDKRVVAPWQPELFL